MKSNYGGMGINSYSNKNNSQSNLDQAKKVTNLLNKNTQSKPIVSSVTAISNSNNRSKPFKPVTESSTKPAENFAIESKIAKNTSNIQGIQGSRLNFMQKYGGTSGLNPQTNNSGQDSYSNTSSTMKTIKDQQGHSKVNILF